MKRTDEEEFDSSEDEEYTEESDTDSEEGFLDGYREEEEVLECAECGKALPADAKKIIKEIEREKYTFCSADCAQDFEDSLGSEEGEG